MPRRERVNKTKSLKTCLESLFRKAFLTKEVLEIFESCAPLETDLASMVNGQEFCSPAQSTSIE